MIRRHRYRCVLWGAREGEIQYGSEEDLALLELDRMLAGLVSACAPIAQAMLQIGEAGHRMGLAMRPIVDRFHEQAELLDREFRKALGLKW